jgi:tetratricopeptide (TPR) repeat protein
MTNDDREYTRPSRQNHPRNLTAAIEHHRAALALAPNFYEARRGLAESLEDSGALAEAEKEYLNLANSDNPPPIQQESNESLTRLYDKMNDRPHALLAARKAEQLLEILLPLVGQDHNFSMANGRRDIAAREEEAGQYVQAASDYLAARNLSNGTKVDQASIYDYDLGRARSLRASGDASSAEATCNGWRSRVFGLHQKLDLSQWWAYGGGLDVVQARWEFSCGDFNKGLQELFQIVNSRLGHPTHHKDWKDEPTQMFLMEPYDALESAFHYRRLPEAARQARAISLQAYDIDHGPLNFEPNQSDIDSLRQLTQKLISEVAKEGGLQHPKP